MQRERTKRRALYVATLLTWPAVAYCVWAMLTYDTRVNLMWLMLSLTLSGVLTGVSALAAFTAPLAGVFQSGYEAGQRSTGCSMYRPMLAALDGQRDARITRLHSSAHTEN